MHSFNNNEMNKIGTIQNLGNENEKIEKNWIQLALLFHIFYEESLFCNNNLSR